MSVALWFAVVLPLCSAGKPCTGSSLVCTPLSPVLGQVSFPHSWHFSFIAGYFSFYRMRFPHDRSQAFWKFAINSWHSLKCLANKIMEPGAFPFPVYGNKKWITSIKFLYLAQSNFVLRNLKNLDLNSDVYGSCSIFSVQHESRFKPTLFCPPPAPVLFASTSLESFVCLSLSLSTPGKPLELISVSILNTSAIPIGLPQSA